MENLPPLNHSSKLIRPPTLKRGRSGDSQGGKVSIYLYSYFNQIIIKNIIPTLLLFLD